MSSLFRLLKILHTIGKYRLDEFLHSSQLAWIYKIFLFPLRCYPKRHDPRSVRLRIALEELGPIFIKFGQLLSTRPDLIPADLIAELNRLQDQVKPFDSKTLIGIIEAELGADLDTLFSSFDQEPLASASIAQVHAASLADNKEVVVKVVRPDIEKTIQQDTLLLRRLAQFIEYFVADGKRFRPIEIVDNYRETILDELDMMREAANASQLRRNWLDSGKLYIPEVYWDYTRSKVLVLERIYGTPVTQVEILRQRGTDLKLLAERGVEIFFTQVFEHNFFHADMHPGNVFVAETHPENPSYIGVDTAIIGSLTREDQYYLARNLIAMFRRDYRQIAELHVQSGWVPPDTSINGFEAAIRSVCEPIFQKPLKDISFGESLISLFRTAQRFNMPVQPQLVLLQKTLVNIEGLGRQLYPELDLWQTAHPYLEKWLKQRYHPRTLWKDLRYHAPEWIEKFPQLPHLVFDTLSEIKQLAELAPELKAAAQSIAQQKARKLQWLAPLLIAVSTILAYFFIDANLTFSKEILLAMGAIALLALRR